MTHHHEHPLVKRLRTQPTLVLGHRGFAARAPENTLAAFSLAVSEGVEGVEFDVRLSSDGQLVVFHDPDLRRLADRPERIVDLTARELSAVAVESNVVKQSTRESIPTLDAVVETLMAGGSAPLMDIEIKHESSPADELAGAVVEAVAWHNLWDVAMISSFHPAVLRAVRRLLRMGTRQLPTALIYREYHWLPAFAERIAAWGIDNSVVHKPQVSLLPRPERGSRALTRPQRGRRRRLPLVWTVNDAGTARDVLQRGACGVIGDDPVRLASWIREAEE